MNILITEAAYRDIWSTAERLAAVSAATSLGFIDGLEERLQLVAKRLDGEAHTAASASEAIQYATHGKYLIFYTASDTDLTVLHISDSAAEIELMLGDRGQSLLNRRLAARSASPAPAGAKPTRRRAAKLRG